MPVKNVWVIVITGIVCLGCYWKAMMIRPAEPLASALQLIDQRYVKPIPQRTLVEAAMRGIVDQLDPYSEYFPPASAELFQQEIAQSFPGIGILIDKPKNADRVRVVTPLVGSPALRAGILPKDILWTVDGKDVAGMEIDQIRGLLRGPEGTRVKLEMKRPGQEELVAVEVERASIPVDSVVGYQRDENDQWQYHIEGHPRIAYIRIGMFGERTTEEVADVLSRLNNDFDALVFDLRFNPGGLLTSACDICDFFLDSGTIVETRERENRLIEIEEATPGVLVAHNKPVVVLLNSDSASASEVMSACLKDHHRAKIAGERSYGKGTIQEVLALESGRSLLKITTSRYFGPSGTPIHRDEGVGEEAPWGVKPDPELEVKFSRLQAAQLQVHWTRAGFPRLARDLMPADLPMDWLEAQTPKEDEPKDAPESSAEPEKETDKGTEEVVTPEDLKAPFEDTQLKRVIEYLESQPAAPTAVAA